MKFSGLAVLALSIVLASSSYADPVHLETGGHLLGETPLGVGQEITFGFTLADATQVSSLHFGIDPVLGGTYSVTITGPGGTVAAQPGLFLAGTYQVAFDGLTCGGPCINNVATYLDYYSPVSFTQIGGTITPGPGVGNGIGWYLLGDTVSSDVTPVPEPGTAALVGSGLLAAFTGMRRRFLKA